MTSSPRILLDDTRAKSTTRKGGGCMLGLVVGDGSVELDDKLIDCNQLSALSATAGCSFRTYVTIPKLCRSPISTSIAAKQSYDGHEAVKWARDISPQF